MRFGKDVLILGITPRLKKFFFDLKRYMPLIYNLTSRDIKLKYRRSVLGYLWSVLNPLFTMVVLTQVFGMLLKVQIENFAVYYIVGVSLWNFFADATNMSLMSIIGSASLIKKVYMPKYVFPLEKCLFAFVNFSLSLVAVVIVMIFQQVVPSLTILLFWVPMLLCFMFTFGFSLILSSMSVFFKDIIHLYSVLLMIWMYLTPLFYPMSLVEGHKILNIIVHCNPMYYFVDYFRQVVMYGTIPSLQHQLIALAFAVGMMIVGAFCFGKAQKKFILYI